MNTTCQYYGKNHMGAYCEFLIRFFHKMWNGEMSPDCKGCPHFKSIDIKAANEAPKGNES